MYFITIYHIDYHRILGLLHYRSGISIEQMTKSFKKFLM